MKRTLPLLLLSLLTTFAGRAQTETTPGDDEETPAKTTGLRIPTGRGKYLVGANVLLAKLTFQKGNETNYSIGIDPKIGVFILPNIALGIAADFMIEGHKGYRAINYGITPFARVYFAHDNADKPARPLQFFAEAGVGFGGINSRTEDAAGVTRATTNGARVYVLPGVDYFLNEHVAAEAGLEYLFTGGKPDAHVIGLNLGFQVFLGR